MLKWLSNLFKPELRSFSLPAVTAWSPTAINYLGGPRSSAGVHVDRLSVLSYPAVWRSLSLVGHKFGRLPLNVYKRDKDGNREVDSEHDAQWLLAHRPSNLYTPHTFKSTLCQHAMLHGNGFAWILRQPDGRPQELIILDPLATGVTFGGGKLLYFTRVGSAASDVKTILPENIIHLKNITHDGLIGYSVIDVLRESFGLGLAAARYGSTYFRNNGSPLTVLKFAQKLDKDQLDYYKREWDKEHLGVENAHRTSILGNGGDIQNMQLDNDAAQFLQTREFEVACGIANIFGIPPHKLGVKVATSYNSLEADEKSFLTDTIDQWLVAFEEECERKLLKESQQIRESHFIEFDRRELEQADTAARSTMLLAELNGGGLTYNQYCKETNKPGIGPDGDRLRLPSGVQFADMMPVPDDDEPASDEPDQPAETVAGQVTDETEPVEVDPVGGGDYPQRKLQALLSSVLRRYVTRLHKAAQTAENRGEWRTWRTDGLEAHRAILEATIAPVADPGAAAPLLDELGQELSAVLADQIDAVFERVDTDQWAERILKGQHA